MRLAAGLIAVLMWTAVADPSGDLEYTFKYSNEPVPALQIDLRITLSARQGLDLALPDRYGGDSDLWRLAKDLTVVEGPCVLRPGPSASRRVLEAASDGTCVVRYSLDAPEAPLTPQNFRLPILRRDYFHLLGNTFLLYPDLPPGTPVRVRFSWHMPRGWRTGNSFGFGEREQRVQTSIGGLIQSVFVAGDFRFVTRTTRHGQPLVVGLRGGWPFSDDELALSVLRIVEAQRELFSDHDFPYYFVSLLPVDMSPTSVSGVGRHNGFAIFRGRGGLLDEQIRQLIAHELTHTWIPFRTTQSMETPAAMYWFSEGFTEFFAQKALLLGTQTDVGQFVTRINAMIEEYWESRARLMSNDAAGAAYFSDPDARRLAYVRGFFIALNWDATIRAMNSGRRSLKDVVRELVRDGKNRMAPLQADYLTGVMAKYGVASAYSDLEKWLRAERLVEIRPDSLGPCAELASESNRPPRFALRQPRTIAGCRAWLLR